MGTISAAVPGQTYDFTVTARSLSGNGRITLNVSCSDWGTLSQYSLLSGSKQQVFSHIFGSNDETIQGTYTVPNDDSAWFLQGTLEFLDSTDYDVSLFSVKRQVTSDTTDNFHLCLSGQWYNVSGPLAENQMVNFSVSPQVLSDAMGVMNFTTRIDGNHYGMVNLVYREPLLMGMNARFRVNHQAGDVYNLTLTKTISRNSAVTTMIWNSKIFQKLPHLTEFLTRMLMKGFTGHSFYEIVKKMFPEISQSFLLYPFSTDPMYASVNITADDGSGMKHVSDNGNLWFSCSSPDTRERYLEVTIPQG